MPDVALRTAEFTLSATQLKLLREIVLGDGGSYAGWQRRSLEALAAAGLITLQVQARTHWGKTGWLGRAEPTEKGRKALEGTR